MGHVSNNNAGLIIASADGKVLLRFDGIAQVSVAEPGRVKIMLWRYAPDLTQEPVLQMSFSTKVARQLGELLPMMLGAQPAIPTPGHHGLPRRTAT